MTETRTSDHSTCRPADRSLGVREGMLITILLLTATAGEAGANERALEAKPPNHNARPLRVLDNGPEALPVASASNDMFTVPEDGGLPRFSVTDFSPRKRNLFDPDPAGEVYAQTPMLRGTTVWQRMADYRSRDRVRLLTLWESSGSTVSLQAGKRGNPSLQWTSTTMNRGGATRGLLDKLFSVSIQGAGQTLRNMGHSKATQAARSGIAAPTVAALK